MELVKCDFFFSSINSYPQAFSVHICCIGRCYCTVFRSSSHESDWHLIENLQQCFNWRQHKHKVKSKSTHTSSRNILEREKRWMHNFQMYIHHCWINKGMMQIIFLICCCKTHGASAIWISCWLHHRRSPHTAWRITSNIFWCKWNHSLASLSSSRSSSYECVTSHSEYVGIRWCRRRWWCRCRHLWQSTTLTVSTIKQNDNLCTRTLYACKTILSAFVSAALR